MKVLIAIDSFKGSLSTFQSGKAVSEGVKRVFSDAETVVCPLADGGEGTVAAITSAKGGFIRKISVSDPLGTPVEAEYGILNDTAIIEMSAAAGITLIEPKNRDPMKTTTFGVGQIILDAITEFSCRNFIIGIGGSATNDGGTGMLTALGFEFLDENGAPIPLGAEGLSKLCRIKTDKALKSLSECTFRIACDVKNPLCGENGCSAVYGPQKGATEITVKLMDGWLMDYALLVKNTLGRDLAEYPGAGAAGGMGYAFKAFLNGELTSGIDLVAEITELEEKIKSADIVVTGEGRLDAQSAMGKAPIGVAKLAKKHSIPVIAFAGAIKNDAGVCNESGIDAFFPILRTPVTLTEAMDIDNAYKNLSDTAEQVFRLIKTFNYN